MAFEPGASSIDLRDRLPVLGIAVRVHPGEGADSTGSAPRPGTLAIRHRNALAALDERQNLTPGYHDGIEPFHEAGPRHRMPPAAGFATVGRHKPASAKTSCKRCGASENTDVTPQSKSILARSGWFTV